MTKVEADYIVIGSGLTGATIARLLTDRRKDVVVIEQRPHLGGNVFDHTHPSGIRVHTYGPHYFRTGSDRIWEFVSRFTDFYPYTARILTEVDGQCIAWPIQGRTLVEMVGSNWTPAITTNVPGNFEEASLALMPRLVYNKFIYGYTKKQWGVEPSTLSAALAKRFDVRQDDDDRLFKHRHQGLPTNGYSQMMSEMLRGIPVVLNQPFVPGDDRIKPRIMLIYTGPVDAFFGYRFGKLAYRGQQRETVYYPDQDSFQAGAQVNCPSVESGGHIRTLEWKKMMPSHIAGRIRGTVVSREFPYCPLDANDYEYPFPDAPNAELYSKYAAEASLLSNVLICGRLGEYRYYDMDQAIARAMLLTEQILD